MEIGKKFMSLCVHILDRRVVKKVTENISFGGIEHNSHQARTGKPQLQYTQRCQARTEILSLKALQTSCKE